MHGVQVFETADPEAIEHFRRRTRPTNGCRKPAISLESGEAFIGTQASIGPTKRRQHLRRLQGQQLIALEQLIIVRDLHLIQIPCPRRAGDVVDERAIAIESLRTFLVPSRCPFAWRVDDLIHYRIGNAGRGTHVV